jgi:hypothetical protein
MLRIRCAFRLNKLLNRSSNPNANLWVQYVQIQTLRRAVHVMGPKLVALAFAGVANAAHVQGTISVSCAQTFMQTVQILIAYLRRADEGSLSRMLVEAIILLAASRQNGTSVRRDAATLYNVGTNAIASKVKQEFAVRARAKKEGKPVPKPEKAA